MPAAQREDCDRWTAIRRGLCLRCPACGRGALLKSYFALCERCAGCGMALGDLRADDGPAWATILLTGHVMAPLLLIASRANAPDWVLYGMLPASALLLALFLLPRAKGAFAALTWTFG